MTDQTRKKRIHWFAWTLAPEEMQEQLDLYSTGKITKTCRGIATLVASGLMVLSLVLSAIGLTDIGDVLVSLVLYVPAIVFTYRGHRWAIVLLMILWTIDKWFGVYYQITANPQGSYAFSNILWWMFITPIFWRALLVENARRKNSIGMSNA